MHSQAAKLFPLQRVLNKEGFKKLSETSLTRICASFGLRTKFKTLFMSDKEKHGHQFDLPLLFNISKLLLGPGPGFEC